VRRRPAPTVLLLQALVLALVQGLATFLPVSASGHQQGVVYLAAWDPAGPGFQLALSLGALAAVVLYFRADLWFLVSGTLAIGRARAIDQERARRTVVLLALASLPGLAAGWWFEPPLFPEFPAERVVAGALYATALLLVAAELLHRRRRAKDLAVPVGRLSRPEAREDTGRHEGTVGVADAVTVGLLQVASIVPGLSRTAVTIAGGMGRGLSRTGATRLSLLLSIPMLAGAALAQYGRLDEAPAGTAPFTGLHVAVAAVVTAAAGYWAIRLLLRLVATEDLLGFARWVALFATLLLIASFLVLG
jgi:undecaprenyl-diphosphatase